VDLVAEQDAGMVQVVERATVGQKDSRRNNSMAAGVTND